MKAEYLVTGGAGFIGSNIVRALSARGCPVRVLDNFSTGRPANLAGLDGDVKVIEGDIRDEKTLRRALKGVRFVLHTAALPSVARSIKDPVSTNSVNICGTLKLLLAAHTAGVERFVFSSSSSVYGDTPTLPKREDMMPMPRSPYALSKLAGEHYCRIFKELHRLQTFSLRYFNVFGPRQDPKSQYAAAIPRFIASFKAGKPPTIYGDGGQTRDFTYVDNVVAANLRCCFAPAKAAGAAYNIGCGDRISVNGLIARIGRIMGKSLKPIHLKPRAGDVRDSQADVSRAIQQLGWKPGVNFEEGLRRTVLWFMGS
jgi:nucleoside-diphosphate-sugar epimerase